MNIPAPPVQVGPHCRLRGLHEQETQQTVALLRDVPQIPLREVRFIADAHLGRLAAYLRMVGFDTLYHDDYEKALQPPTKSNC